MKRSTRKPVAGICTHGQRDWVDMLDCFEAVKISFITCQHHLKGVYETNFPDSLVISIAEGNRGLVAESGDYALSRKELDFLGRHWKELSFMLDRVEFNPNRPRISNYERSHLINKVSAFYLELVNKCDFVFFADIPHSLYDYLLYLVCRLSKRRTVILKKSLPLPRYFTLSETIAWNSDGNVKSFANPSEDFRGDIESFVSSKTRSYKESEPYYMARQRKNKNYGSVWSYLKNPSRLLSAFTPKAKVSVEAVLSMKYSTLPSTNQLFYLSYLPRKILNFYFKRNLRRRYEQHSLAFEPAQLQSFNYIFLGLHFQPEMSSLPLGGVFFDQEVIVRLLHSILPRGWRLLIKEHPSQLQGPLNSINGRWDGLYEVLDSFENAFLCDYQTDTFELIDNAQFVASISGTIVLEALARRKQVLLFSDIWIQNLKAVHKINSKKDIRHAFGTSFPYESEQELVDDILAYMGDFFYSAPSNSREQNQAVITHALTLMERGLFKE